MGRRRGRCRGASRTGRFRALRLRALGLSSVGLYRVKVQFFKGFWVLTPESGMPASSFDLGVGSAGLGLRV